MPVWGTVNDLNRRYIVFYDEKEKIQGDFRYRMLRENHMKGVIPLDVRNINGEYGVFFEITDMESIETISQIHELSFEDIDDIFKALIKTSSELERHFCEEESMVVIPDLIFKNMVTNEYGFICLPPQKGDKKDEWQKDLILFFMDNINSAETRAIDGLFSIYDMISAGFKSYKTLYEKLLLYKKDNPDSLGEKEDEVIEGSLSDKNSNEDILEQKKEKKHHFYVPSVKESIAGVCILSGIVSIFVYLYLGWI